MRQSKKYSYLLDKKGYESLRFMPNLLINQVVSENNRRYPEGGTGLGIAQGVLRVSREKITEGVEGETLAPSKTGGGGLNGKIEIRRRKIALGAASVIEQQKAIIKPANHQKGLMILLSKSPHSLEHKRYIETVVGTTLPRVRESFKNAGIDIPSDDEIFQQMIMTDRFSQEETEALIKNIQTPGLIILPPQMQGFRDYERFLNANKKRPVQNNVFVSDNRREAFVPQDKIVKKASASYRFGIGEISQELKNRRGKLRNIVAKWQNEGFAKVLRIPTPKEFAVLQGQATDLLDMEGWSILCEDNKLHKVIEEKNLVSGGRGYAAWLGDGGYGVQFHDHNPDRTYLRVRVRPVAVK